MVVNGIAKKKKSYDIKYYSMLYRSDALPGGVREASEFLMETFQKRCFAS